MKTLGFCQPKDLGKQSTSCPVSLAAGDNGSEHCLIQNDSVNSKTSLHENDTNSSKLLANSELNKNGLPNTKHFNTLLNGLLVQTAVSDNSSSSPSVDTDHDKYYGNSSILKICVPECSPIVKEQSDDSADLDIIKTFKAEPFQSSLSPVSPNRPCNAKFYKRPSLECLVAKLHHRVDESGNVAQACFIEPKTTISNTNILITKFNNIPSETNCDSYANLRNDAKDVLKLKDCCKNYKLDEHSKCDCQIHLMKTQEKSRHFQEHLKCASVVESPLIRTSLVNSKNVSNYNSSLKNIAHSDNFFRDKVKCSVDTISDCSKVCTSNVRLAVDLEDKQYSDKALDANSCIVNLDCKEHIADSTHSPNLIKEASIASSSGNISNVNAICSLSNIKKFERNDILDSNLKGIHFPTCNVSSDDNGSPSTIVQTSLSKSVNLSDNGNIADKLKNDSYDLSDGNIFVNHPKILSFEKNLNSPISLSKSSSNTPMFSETPSDASQSEMMVKISDAVAALFSCTTEDNLSEYVDPSPELEKGNKCLPTCNESSENSKPESVNTNLNFSVAFMNEKINEAGTPIDLPCFLNSGKASVVLNESESNSKAKHFYTNSSHKINFLSPRSLCSRQNPDNAEANVHDEKEEINYLSTENVPVVLEEADGNNTLELNSVNFAAVKKTELKNSDKEIASISNSSSSSIFINSKPAKAVTTEFSNVVNTSEDTCKLNAPNCEINFNVPLTLVQLPNSPNKIEEIKCKNGYIDLEKKSLQTDNPNCKSDCSNSYSKCISIIKEMEMQECGILNKNECLSGKTSENVLKETIDVAFTIEIENTPGNNNSDERSNLSVHMNEFNFKPSLASSIVKNKVVDNLQDTLQQSHCNSEQHEHLLANNSDLLNDAHDSQNEIKIEPFECCKGAPVHAVAEISESEYYDYDESMNHSKGNIFCDTIPNEMISEQCNSSGGCNLQSSKEILQLSSEDSSMSCGKLNTIFFSTEMINNSNSSSLEDRAILSNNSFSDKSSLVELNSTFHAHGDKDTIENSNLVESDFIEDQSLEALFCLQENKIINKFSFNDFLLQIFERDTGECNICKTFELDLKLHAALEHSCITYIPVYLTQTFHHHMKERVGIYSIPCNNVPHGSPYYVCRTCGFILKSVESVRLHMNIHENVYMVADSNNSCKCEKLQYSYSQHKLRKLLLGSTHICSFCNYCFACKYGLINHLKLSHFRMDACVLCNVEVLHEDSIKVLAHNESHNTNTEQVLSNLLMKDFIEPLRDQTHFSWNALNNHLNYLDGKIFRLRTPENIKQKINLSIPVKADPEYAVTPECFIISPALEINKYLKGKLFSRLTGTEIDEYTSVGFDMPVQILFKKKFCSKRGRKRNSNTCINKASSRMNTRFSVSAILNLHKLHSSKTSAEYELTSLPLRRSSRHSKTNLDDQDHNNILKQVENDELDLHLTRTRSGMRPKEVSEEDTNVVRNQEKTILQVSTFEQGLPLAEISGEWVNYHTFVCCSCGAVLSDLAAIMDHKWEAHPGVWCAHTMIRGQGAVPEMFCRQYLPATIVPDVNSKKKSFKAELNSYLCTQCKGKFSKLDSFHAHLIECGGLHQLVTSRKKTRNKKNFRFRRRKGQGIPSQRYANNFVAPTPQKASDSGTSTPNKELPYQSLQSGSASVVKRRLEMAISSLETTKLKSKLKVILSKVTRRKREMVGQRGRTFKMKLRKKMQQKKVKRMKLSEMNIKRNRSTKIPQISSSPTLRTVKLSSSRRRNTLNKSNIYDEKVSGTAKVILQDIGEINEIKPVTSKSLGETTTSKNSSLTNRHRKKKSFLKENPVLELSTNASVESKRKKHIKIKNKHNRRSSEIYDDPSKIETHSLSDNFIKAADNLVMNVDKNSKMKTISKKIIKSKLIRNNRTSSLSCESKIKDIPSTDKECNSKSHLDMPQNYSLNPTMNCKNIIKESHLLEVPVEPNKGKVKVRKVGSRLKGNKSLKKLMIGSKKLENISDFNVDRDNENRGNAMATLENSIVFELPSDDYKIKIKKKKKLQT